MSDKFLRSEKEQLLNAIGSELSWGWSPAIDFVELLGGRGETSEDKSDSAALTPTTTTTPSTECSHQQQEAIANKKKEVVEEDDELDAMMRAFELKTKAPVATRNSSDGEDTAVRTRSVLLAGACDIRHILRTVASLRVKEEEERDTKEQTSEGGAPASAATEEYHFYLYEPNLRTHCRHLFFLQWLLDSMFALEELEERVLMFLEVFGNSLVREITAAQTRGVAQRLLKGFEKESGNLMPLVSFADMKMKEKDFVEEQLGHWVRDTSVTDVEEQWSRRVRQEFADRYDNRDNLIDWDFVFHLTEYTNLLKFPEYRTWRNTGLAYDVCHINPRKGFTYVYNVANKSLCHFSRKGQGVYCGDVKNGPFYALGATTANEHICHRTSDGTCKYGNGVVAMHNVRAWLFTLMTGKTWPWADHAFAWDDPKNYNYLPPGTPSGVEYKASFPRVRFHFIGLDFDRFLLPFAKPSARRLDAAFVGTSCTHLLTPALLQSAMHQQAVVVAETAKFVVNAEDAAKEAFVAKIEGLSAAAGWATDVALTTRLQAGQPAPRRTDNASPTEAQLQSAKRYHYPFQVALTRSTTPQ